MRRRFVLLAVLMLCAGPISLNAQDADKELKAVQGQWERTVRTSEGTFKIVKVHDGNATELSVYDADGNTVESKTSEFRLDVTGPVRIFTFFNNKITAGRGVGETSSQESSYVYRVVGDTFFEYHGLLVGDREPPMAFTWKRVQE